MRSVHVKDGQGALEFLFGTGAYAERDLKEQPKVVLLDIRLTQHHRPRIKLPRLGQRAQAIDPPRSHVGRPCRDIRKDGMHLVEVRPVPLQKKLLDKLKPITQD